MDLEEQQAATDLVKWFVGSTIAYMLIVFLRSLVLQTLWLHASTNMHNTMAEKVLRANIVFFDSNPIGRITTRFSRDMTILDTMLPAILVLATQGIMRSIAVAITVSTVNPNLLVVMFVCLLYIRYVVNKGIRPMVDAQRFDQLFYAPINSTFSMVINGIITLRAYKKFDHFRILFI